MKYSMQKPLLISALSSVLLMAACGGNAELDNAKMLNARKQKELQLQIEKKARVTLTENAIEVAQKSRLAKRKIDYREAPLAKMSIHQQPLHNPIGDRSVDNRNTENYSRNSDNPFNLVTKIPVSTFSIDVDTASYANVRRLLNQGTVPPTDAVRAEEMINYFSYDYPQPKTKPFSVYNEVGPSPFNIGKHLIHIGIKGNKIENSVRPDANLVFLLDVSGSMNRANKLGLLKNALKMLSKQLSENDRVAIVVYAGAAGTVLEPTNGDNHAAIIDALMRLSAGGSTNGGAGIELAYRLAQQSFIKDGINRVILATDGDFNLGIVNQQTLKEKIEQQRKSGVSLTVLGFGSGNYNDSLMQELAQNGNGNAFYIDNLNEARKVLVEELSSTLVTIAKDVKVQVEFNPEVVSEYRLIGYETRALKREDFNNDNIDAGDIGAGHTVTAIYEISLKGVNNQSVDPLRYQPSNDKLLSKDTSTLNELAFLKLRYKLPQQKTSQLIEIAIKSDDIIPTLKATSKDFKFSAAVAGFAQLLRGGKYLSSMEINTIIKLAQQGKGLDKHGYRAEFINMVKLADALAPQLTDKTYL